MDIFTVYLCHAAYRVNFANQKGAMADVLYEHFISFLVNFYGGPDAIKPKRKAANVGNNTRAICLIIPPASSVK